ncbi:FAD-dependent oxidoreductase [Candidatus Peregrinibacteria bacterium]|nr:FAD-dependent oxidoreductase [Candidatus Peregrinibacteria bacterium]
MKVKTSPIICKVEEVRFLTPHICSLSFQTEKPFEFQGGQYINILIPDGSVEKAFSRNYSIATPPEKRPLELCFELVGTGTSYLNRLKPGDTFKIRGPYGEFVFDSNPNRHFCYVGTGSGIGPFRSIAFSSVFQNTHPISVTCILGVENEEEIPYRDELEKFALEKPTHHFIPVLSRPKSKDWKGKQG